MDKVTREKSVFECQKEELSRLLWEMKSRMDSATKEREDGLESCNIFEDIVTKDVIPIIADIQAELDNMDEEAPPENPKEPNINIYGHVHGHIHIKKGVHLHLHGDINPSKPDDYGGPWPYELLNTGTIWPQSQLPPAEDVGCQLSDAMGGEEPECPGSPEGEHVMEQHEGWDVFCVYCGYQHPRTEPLAEEPAPKVKICKHWAWNSVHKASHESDCPECDGLDTDCTGFEEGE